MNCYEISFDIRFVELISLSRIQEQSPVLNAARPWEFLGV